MRSGHRNAALLLVAALLLPVAMCACGKAVGETIDDATITTRVKTALLNDPDVEVLGIDVSTTAGVVTLSGDVTSAAEADRAVRVARTVQGVKDVKSTLKTTRGQISPMPRGPAAPAPRSASG